LPVNSVFLFALIRQWKSCFDESLPVRSAYWLCRGCSSSNHKNGTHLAVEKTKKVPKA